MKGAGLALYITTRRAAQSGGNRRQIYCHWENKRRSLSLPAWHDGGSITKMSFSPRKSKFYWADRCCTLGLKVKCQPGQHVSFQLSIICNNQPVAEGNQYIEWRKCVNVWSVSLFPVSVLKQLTLFTHVDYLGDQTHFSSVFDETTTNEYECHT